MLIVDVAGETCSGKTTELLRIAVELTQLGRTVALINRDDNYDDLARRFLHNGGAAGKFVIKRTVEDAIEQAVHSWSFDYILTETHVSRSEAEKPFCCARRIDVDDIEVEARGTFDEMIEYADTHDPAYTQGLFVTTIAAVKKTLALRTRKAD